MGEPEAVRLASKSWASAGGTACEHATRPSAVLDCCARERPQLLPGWLAAAGTSRR